MHLLKLVPLKIAGHANTTAVTFYLSVNVQ